MRLLTNRLNPFKTLNSYLPALLLVFLAACSGGGADVEETDRPGGGPTNGYTGPAPATEDVQKFKREVWDNLSLQTRCGQCHGGDQAPDFVDLTDVNTAYTTANTLVNLSQPNLSELVSKVAGGHNCWLSSDQACADTITSYITAWAGDSATSSNTIALTAPEIHEPGAVKSFPDTSDSFGTTVYPLLRQYCADCHDETSANPIAPFFANEDVDSAYAAARSRIDLDTPANSRFVVRLRSEFHNCWSDCASDANEMQAAIQAFTDAIPVTQIDPDLLVSKALQLSDGIIASGGGRHEPNIIAKWEFKEGSEDPGANQAFDTSGLEPAIHLTLTGSYNWVGGWGVQIIDGKAQGSTSSSKKLHDLIKSTGEYSIEAWVIPANVSQEGPAGIVSYSAGTTNRNFTLGQTLYNYDFLNRSSETDANGQAALSTPDADEVLQTALQHVVATFSPVEGRKIFVNGELVAEETPENSANINDWNDTYALVMGNEVSSNRLWQGILKMVAIHNRALTLEQIQQNFDVGVGQKFFMLFDISHLINLADSYVMYEVSQWDSYAYLFNQPTFINLDDQNIPDNVNLEDLRIMVNSKILDNGQAYKNLQTTLNSTDYNSATGQKISPLGTIVALDKGPQSDWFALAFGGIGSGSNPFPEPPPPTPAAPVDLDPHPEIGVRNFVEINASMSKATGISMAQPDVAQTFELVKQQMPTLTDIGIFSSSQQMGITQLAIEYCNALVEDNSARASYFGGFDFNAAADVAFDTPAERDQIFDPLITKALGSGLSSQPSDSDIKTELNNLVDRLTACGGGCASDRTETVVKAACAAVIGSAAMLVQ